MRKTIIIFLLLTGICRATLIERVRETERFKTYEDEDDLIKYLKDLVVWNEKTYSDVAGRVNWLIDRDEFGAGVKLIGDEESVIWYNGDYTWAEKASGSLAASYVIIKPPDIGATGKQLTVSVSGTTGTMSWEDPGGIGGVGDIDAVGDATSGSAFTVTGAGNSLWFEGSTADGIETILTAADPTGTDKTITLPNITGTVILSGHSLTGDVTGTAGAAATTALSLNGDCVDENHIADNGIDSEHYNDDSIDAEHINTITCGTNCTWDAANDEVDVDDAFVKNSEADTMAGDLTFDNTATQDWLWTGSFASLALQAQSAATAARFQLYSKDGDETDDILYEVYTDGAPGEIDNSQWMRQGWNQTEGAFRIEVGKSGTGSNKSLEIVTTNELRLEPAAILYLSGGAVYSTTIEEDETAESANMHISNAGKIYKSVSGRGYKTNIVYLTEGEASFVLDLKPRKFNSRCAGDDKKKDFYGFIADEVAAVCPQAARYDPNGVPDGYDDRFILAALVKTVQEQEARIRILEEKIK